MHFLPSYFRNKFICVSEVRNHIHWHKVPQVHLALYTKEVGLKIEQKRSVPLQKKQVVTCAVVARRCSRDCENERDGGCGW
jgi:hypothetical protein